MRIEKPYRQKQTATIHLGSAANDVFALMCPVVEHEWVPGWKTKSIYSNSGLVERDCIFVTPGANDKDATWITTDHDPSERRLTMYKIIPGENVTRLDIAVDPKASGSTATISYEHTALSETGRELVDHLTKSRFMSKMNEWEKDIDRYLSGKDS